MRVMIGGLMFVTAILAAEDASLENAVALFRSSAAATREAGSQLADRELRKLLAPVLKAMEDPDPEVRRRARRAILALVPGELEREEEQRRQRQAAARRAAIVPGWRLVPVQRKIFAEKFRAELKRNMLEAAQARKLHQLLGLEATRFRGVVVVNQVVLSGGLRVTKVGKNSRAAALGLAPRDLVLWFDGKPIETHGDVLAALGPKPAWDRITVEVLRRGQLVRLTAGPQARTQKSGR
ncbi:MAG: PDZ domain-containing protein [Planctomycetota bacterium]|jgi:hypothetical protein